jgi:hypothetical protein
MKKIISLMTAAVTVCSGMTFTVNAADETTVVKNEAYFYSLSDDEVYAEYKEYCETNGISLEETVIRDGGIIEYDFAMYLSMQINYGNATSLVDFEFPEIKGVKKTNITSKSGEYFGLSNTEWDSGNVDFYYDSGTSFNGDEGGFRTESNCEMNNAYNFMRDALVLYNSQFYADYGAKGRVKYQKLDKMTEYVSGDADLDAKLTVNDAVKVMCYVANSEKYPLYITGAELADVYETGDGINNMDALEIQKKLAQVIS